MSYLRHIRRLNNYRREDFIALITSGIQVGEIKPAFAGKLEKISVDFERDTLALHWNPPADTFEERNRAMDELTDRLLDAGLFPYRHGELYPVTTGDRERPLFLIDRALAPWFGVRAFGQHLNGYIRRGGETLVWIARRSPDRRIEPGKLDNLVAGGLPWNLGLAENLAKECREEAGIPAELAAGAQATGYISYRREIEDGLKPDTMYCYDLELPADFTPRCTDGEVEEFMLWPLRRLAREIRETDNIKRNCNLVMIDFLVRHGCITAEHPEYDELLAGLRA